MNSNQLILIYGPPASGKYTMAKKLKAKGALLIDNHYFHDFVRPFIEKGVLMSPEYKQNISKIKTAFYDILRTFYPKDHPIRYIITDLMDQSQPAKLKFYTDLASMINAEFIPIELTAEKNILIIRCQTHEREMRGKIFHPDRAASQIKNCKTLEFNHPNKLSINVSNLNKDETYLKIREHLKKFDHSHQKIIAHKSKSSSLILQNLHNTSLQR